MATEPLTPYPHTVETAHDAVRTADGSLPVMDYPAHERSYRRFLHLLKWVIIHAVFLISSLYFFIIAHQPALGGFLLLIAVFILGYAVVTTGRVGRDIATALDPDVA